MQNQNNQVEQEIQSTKKKKKRSFVVWFLLIMGGFWLFAQLNQPQISKDIQDKVRNERAEVAEFFDIIKVNDKEPIKYFNVHLKNEYEAERVARRIMTDYKTEQTSQIYIRMFSNPVTARVYFDLSEKEQDKVFNEYIYDFKYKKEGQSMTLKKNMNGKWEQVNFKLYDF